jgi:plasmid stabilization system protein ParE
MAYKITWSPEALESFDAIVEYINNRFTEKEAKQFVGLVNRRLLLLQKVPQTFRTTVRTSMRRKTVIHKRTILFYKIREKIKVVELLSFFDTRQNPRKHRF